MVRVNVELKPVKRKLTQASVIRGRVATANQMVSDMNPFVPMDEGILRQTGHSNKGGTKLHWDMPYAAEMFYMMKRNYTTPGTGPRWDNKGKAIYMHDWLNTFVKGADW